MTRPPALSGSIMIFGTSLATYYVLILVLAPAIALGLYFMLQRTKIGWMIRAATHNREMASALASTSRGSSCCSSCSAPGSRARRGALRAAGSIVYYMHTQVLMECFLVMVIGGSGVIGGFRGAILFGLLNSFGSSTSRRPRCSSPLC